MSEFTSKVHSPLIGKNYYFHWNVCNSEVFAGHCFYLLHEKESQVNQFKQEAVLFIYTSCFKMVLWLQFFIFACLQIWSRLRLIGSEMVSLSNDLSELSRGFCREPVRAYGYFAVLCLKSLSPTISLTKMLIFFIREEVQNLIHREIKKTRYSFCLRHLVLTT